METTSAKTEDKTMKKNADQGPDPTTAKRSDKAINGSAPSVTTMRTAPNARQATGTQTVTNTANGTTTTAGGTSTAANGDTSKSKATTPTSTPQKASSGVGTPKVISKVTTPKAGTTKPSAVKSNATLEGAQSTVELNLRKELAASRALIEALTKENAEMLQMIEQERNRMTDLTDQERSEATYSQQVSRLVRVFRELDVNLPPLDLEDWNARRVADQVREVIGDAVRAVDESIQFNSALECLRLILGAAEIVPSSRPNTFKFILRNEMLKREMSFWLSWTDTTFTYTKINIDIPEKDAPEFVSEQSIDFDVRQGPNFLLQVLGCVFHQS